MKQRKYIFPSALVVLVAIMGLTPIILRAQAPTPTPFIFIGLFEEEENDFFWEDPEEYYRFSGELIKICTEDPGLAKEAALLLRSSSADLESLMKYGSPGLSPLEPANLKLVSEETIDGARGLLAIFKNRASTELKDELDRFEKELPVGKSGSSVIDDKTLIEKSRVSDPVKSTY